MTVGHRLVGAIGDRFLKKEAEIFLKTHLPEWAKGSLEIGAPWADQIKSNPKKYGWSFNLHYYNPPDNPPHFCSMDFPTSCSCIIGAIYNFTTQIQNRHDHSLNANSFKIPNMNITEPLLFIDHFIGDIHQPLHGIAMVYCKK